MGLLQAPRTQNFASLRRRRRRPRITQDDVAARIPKNAAELVPATDGANIAGAAFGNWLALASEVVPDNRVRQWQDLPGLPISVWSDPLQSFERALRQKAGEVLGWSGLVQARAVRGSLRVRPRDDETRQNVDGSSLRFNLYGFDPDARPADMRSSGPAASPTSCCRRAHRKTTRIVASGCSPTMASGSSCSTRRSPAKVSLVRAGSTNTAGALTVARVMSCFHAARPGMSGSA
jgi:hypothetical protein